MVEEYSVVTANKTLNEKVKAGSCGTVLMVYNNPELAYEVEFVNSDGETLDIITVTANDIDI